MSCAGIESKDGETCVDYIRSRHSVALPRAPSGAVVVMRQDCQNMQNAGELLDQGAGERGCVWAGGRAAVVCDRGGGGEAIWSLLLL